MKDEPPPSSPAAQTGRPVADSRSEYSEIALPNDANPFGNLLGGRIMHLVDLTGAIAAVRHSRVPVVTASVDYMTFLHPVHIGELLILKSSVNRVFRTSMEVGVKVWVENLSTGVLRHTSSAYLTFVAVDANNQKVPVPPVIPHSGEEVRRYEEAGKRREYRLAQRARNSKTL
jgi:acyl-CoA hydrolase